VPSLVGTPPVYAGTPAATSPFTGIDAGANSVPAFADANGDGVLDLLLGDSSGAVVVHVASGPAGTPVFTATPALPSPYAGFEVGGLDSRNIVLAGVGDDRVNQPPRPATNDPAAVANGGQDIVIGDNGTVTWDGTGNLTGFGSAQLDLGGNDLIDVGNGGNIVVGGFGNDTITSGAGSDTILGDNGTVTAVPGTGQLLQVVSTDTSNATGGDDTINAGDGNNLIIGGVGADTISGGRGVDIVVGDNAQVDFTGGAPTSVASIDTSAITGGNDVINVGDGNNVVLGGVGGDSVNTGSGNDVVVGDTGTVVLDGAGNVLQVATGDPILGGDDNISTGAGNDIAIGGAGADTIVAGAGNDFLIGDGGLVTVFGAVITVGSKDPAYGGNDTLDGGPGNDVIIGGAGLNTIIGSSGEDVLIGNNGTVIVSGGIVTATGTGGGTLLPLALEEVLKDLFDGLPGSLAELRDLLALDRTDPLFDVALFRKLFSLGGRGALLGGVDAELFRILLDSDVISLPEAPGHGDLQGSGDTVAAQDEAVDGQAPVVAGVGHRAADDAQDALGMAQEMAAGPADQRYGLAGDMLVAAFGAAGLMAVRQPATELHPPAAVPPRTCGQRWRRLRRGFANLLRR